MVWFILSTLILQARAAETCLITPSLYQKRSAEIAQLEKEDQADRPMDGREINWQKVSARDLNRRKRVAEIFAEGCFKEAKDYAHAALIFQHGTVPDHFYQTFLWANTAVKLGDNSQAQLVALGLDRYLVSGGKKQLFGSQFQRDDKGKWCMEPLERSFPDSTRSKYFGMSLAEHTAFTLKAYHAEIKPEDLPECAHDLKPSPAGTVPGFW